MCQQNACFLVICASKNVIQWLTCLSNVVFKFDFLSLLKSFE